MLSLLLWEAEPKRGGTFHISICSENHTNKNWLQFLLYMFQIETDFLIPQIFPPKQRKAK